MNKPKAILSNRLYIESRFVRKHHCDNYSYRIPTGDDDEELLIESWREFEKNGVGYHGFCRGDLGKLKETFESEFEIEDQRAIVPIPKELRLRFTGKLRPDQDRVAKEWIANGFGVIHAPPRFGKTITTIYTISKLMQRAFIFTHTIDLVEQWEEEFRKFTNINELEKQANKPLLGIYRESKQHFPLVTLCTYQSFLSLGGKTALKEMKDQYGLVWMDECHVSSADGCATVLNKVNSYYRGGVTATPYRSRDFLHVITHDVIGPVVTVGTEEGLSCDYHIVKTDHTVQKFKSWATFTRRLSKDESRNALIADWVVKDVRDGRSVLVTTDRKAHVFALKDAIELIAPELIGKVEILTGSTKVPMRKDIRRRCRTGETKVLIGMNKIIQLGYNVPRWSAFHNTLPITSPENWYQRFSRIRTPYTEDEAEKFGAYDKPKPIIRVYVDSGSTGAVWAYHNMVVKQCEKYGFDRVHVAKPKTEVVDKPTSRLKNFTAVGT